MEQEGLPITEGLGGVEDITEAPRGRWARLGGRGAFIQLMATIQGERGIVVGEIPPGKALEPEKHLYEEVIYIVRGLGSTELWQDGFPKRSFEWGPGSLFAPPLNFWHRLVNGSREPVIFVAVSNAPEILDRFHNVDFVFNCDYVFNDRYSGEADYFNPGQKRYRTGQQNVWETNFIPDVMTAALDPKPWKGSGNMSNQFEISGNFLVGHLADWPVGRYHKAHWHGPGALIVGLRSRGYVLLWSKEMGSRPYQNGKASEVIKINWRQNSIYSPPDGWYHQHFNTGPEPARHLAIRTGSRLYRFTSRRFRGGDDAPLTSQREGGNLLDYEDEDPRVRSDYERALRSEGIACQMPPVEYR
jgi:oxalate decarboxylase/phosphoglucose isomerase-like protein (cupin superfamily)